MNVINKLKEPWSFYRYLRLAMSAFFGYKAITDANWLFGVFSLILLFQAVLNIKCLPCEVTGACDTTPKKASQKNMEDIQFEEVK